MARDAAYVALLARLRAALPTVTWSRPPGNWTQLTGPTGILAATDQTPANEAPGMPRSWRLNAQAEIWFQTQPGTDPDATLNGYVDSVNAALRVQTGENPLDEQTTLGGAVVAAWIEGAVRFADQDQVSGVLIPITMLVAD